MQLYASELVMSSVVVKGQDMRWFRYGEPGEEWIRPMGKNVAVNSTILSQDIFEGLFLMMQYRCAKL